MNFRSGLRGPFLTTLGDAVRDAVRKAFRNPSRRSAHADTASRFETAAWTAGFGCVTPSNLLRLRARLAIFCLRLRLNIDLSPLTPDMNSSLYRGHSLNGGKH